MRTSTLDPSMAVSSSLDSIHVTPRTPITARSRAGLYENGENLEEVELSLLGDEERRQAARGLEEEELGYDPKRPISTKDKKAMVLLCVLCE